MKHPPEFFGRPLEAAVVDPDNPVVVSAHLPCAAQELPLEQEGETVFDLAELQPLLETTGPKGPSPPERLGPRLVRPGPLSPEGGEHPGYGETLLPSFRWEKSAL